MKQASGDDASDVRSGFAGVGANQSVRRRMIAMKEFRHGTAESKKSGVVEGRRTGDAADTVRSEILSWHSVKGR